MLMTIAHWYVSTHSRAEAAATSTVKWIGELDVSTHSRAEAAACVAIPYLGDILGFNTQPRGGGCASSAQHLRS